MSIVLCLTKNPTEDSSASTSETKTLLKNRAGISLLSRTTTSVLPREMAPSMTSLKKRPRLLPTSTERLLLTLKLTTTQRLITNSKRPYNGSGKDRLTSSPSRTVRRADCTTWIPWLTKLKSSKDTRRKEKPNPLSSRRILLKITPFSATM